MHKHTNSPRSGFTLIELMIVVAIIGVLLSIVGVAVMNTIVGARTAATKATLTKVQRQMQSRIEAVTRAFKGQLNSTQLFSEIAAVDRTASQAPASREDAVRKALMQKVYLRTYLPQTWSEASFLLKKSGKSAPSQINPKYPSSELETESAEVLYFFLSDASVVGFTPANQGLFTGNEVRDTDGNGALEIVDAWGKPLRFYRWPTRLLRPSGYVGSPTGVSASDAISNDDFERAQLLIFGIPTSLKVPPNINNPGSFAQDPDDPLNVLVPGNGWSQSAAAITTFETGTSSPFPFHTPFTWHTPLVVSAGPDGLFGIRDSAEAGHLGRLCEPFTTGTEQTFLFDNITNLNIKSGGN